MTLDEVLAEMERRAVVNRENGQSLMNSGYEDDAGSCFDVGRAYRDAASLLREALASQPKPTGWTSVEGGLPEPGTALRCRGLPRARRRAVGRRSDDPAT